MATPRNTRAEARSPLMLAATVVGATFLLVGILGFVPGVTENVDDIEFAGSGSGAELLGLFQVSILHNIVHILFGALGLAAARAAASARSYLIGGGLVYGLLALYGAVVDRQSDGNFIPVNGADNWLHLGLAAGMIGLGLILGREAQPTRADGRTASA
jgi:hypothetical protein